MVKSAKNRNTPNYTVYKNPLLFSGGKIKAKKSFKFSLSYLKYGFIAAVILFLTYLLFFSSEFMVKDILVEGNNLLSADQISAGIPKGQNIFLFDSVKTERMILTKFPEISNLEIYRGIPNALKIVVLEKDGKLVWQNSSGQYLVSSQGDVARKIIGDEGKGLPVVTDLQNVPVNPGDHLVSPNFIAFIDNLQNGFFQAVNITLTGFEVGETTFDVNAKTDAGFYVKFNSLRSSKKQLDSLKTVLVAHRPDIHQYVDLRIDGWAYYQ